MTIHEVIKDAQHRMTQESTRGLDWTFHQVMRQADRDDFDRWLVSIGHVLATEPGTQESRFRRFMTDLQRGIYKGPMP